MLFITVVTIVIALAAVALFAIAILYPKRLYPNLQEAELRGVEDAAKRIELRNERARLRNDTRNSILQPFTILTIFATILFTWQQLQGQNKQREDQLQQFNEQISLSRDGQTADRYTHAIDQLTSDRPEVRAGGLYALGEIANQGSGDKPGTASGLRVTIDEVVASYLRSRFPLTRTATCQVRPVKLTIGNTGVPEAFFDPLHADEFSKAAVDLDAAMTVLARRIPNTLAVVDLKHVKLLGATASDAQLYGANFEGSWLDFIDFSHANLFRANLPHIVACNSSFIQADLRQSTLNGAALNGSSMLEAKLSGASLTDASLINSNLANANLSGAILSNADLRKSNLTGANLSKADLYSAKLSGAIADKKTIWPTGFDWRSQGVKYCPDLASCHSQ
jgi:uncharacterized protein YjbI with pentapeptide repeats